MDRNLGASRVAISLTDSLSFGDLYQWGRKSDGHQCRNSSDTSLISSISSPSHGKFILTTSQPYNWLSPLDNNLWQGVNGKNNPCPIGYRLPSESELDQERLSWNSNNSLGAFGSPLKWSISGYRNTSDGQLYFQHPYNGLFGLYWSSTITINGNYSKVLYFDNINSNIQVDYRASGVSIRCIKD